MFEKALPPYGGQGVIPPLNYGGGDLIGGLIFEPGMINFEISWGGKSVWGGGAFSNISWGGVYHFRDKKYYLLYIFLFYQFFTTIIYYVC